MERQKIKSLDEKEIKFLKKNWSRSKYSHSLFCQNNFILVPYFKELKKYKVIEIGPGFYPINSAYPCKEYYGVDSFCEEYIMEDGLSFLIKQEDSSAVIVSFGVFDDCVLKGWRGGLFKKYVDELVEEIKRVMDPFAIICGWDAEKYMGKADIPELYGDFESFGGVYLLKQKFYITENKDLRI